MTAKNYLISCMAALNSFRRILHLRQARNITTNIRIVEFITHIIVTISKFLLNGMAFSSSATVPMHSPL